MDKMTTGERMVWSSVYAAALLFGRSPEEAAKLAASEVRVLRRMGARQALLADDWEGQDMIDQMLRGDA